MVDQVRGRLGSGSCFALPRASMQSPTMRRALHDGQKPRHLQLKATRYSWRHWLHLTLRNPCKSGPRTIRERLKDSVLLERVHHIRSFGGRKILYIWGAIEVDMQQASVLQVPALPTTARG